MPGDHGYDNEEKERKQRIKKMKAKTSKMRLSSIQNMDKRSIIRNQRLYDNAITKRTLEQGEGPGIQGRDKKDIPYGQSYRTVGHTLGSYRTGPNKGQPEKLDPRRTYSHTRVQKSTVNDSPTSPPFQNKSMKTKKR